MKPTPSPWSITKPCTADWDKMRGDDQRRFCEQCQKYVHNVSAMSQSERADFAQPSNERECVVYFQRTNGEVADLSFLAALRRRFPFLRLACWSALVALLPVTLTGCMMGARPISVTAIQKAETITPSQDTQQPTGTDGQ
jgi:hypothetical protein